MWTQQEVRTLKVGRHLNVDDEPCKILSMSTSKPGKHGEAKASIDVIGLFDGKKRTVSAPVTHKVRVPMIDRRSAQVLSIQGSEVQLMDRESYEIFNVPIPDEFSDALAAAAGSDTDVQFFVAMGRSKITKV